MDKLNCVKCKEYKPKSEFHFKKTENRHFSWCKSCLYGVQKFRWQERKRKVVELMGGCCCKCGYNKNYACLDLHHLDPKLKEYDWRKLKQLSWGKVIKEIKKCILVCRNCHGEIHNPDMAKSNLPIELDNISLNTAKTIILTGQCLVCQNPVYGTKYCSQSCARLDRRVVERPTKEELEQMILETNYCAIGRKYGVSDNAVRKWAKNYGLLQTKHIC